MVFLTDLVDHQWLTIFKTFSSTEISEISSAVTCKHACYTFWPCHMQTLCWCFAASVLQKWLQCKDRSHQNFSIRFLQPIVSMEVQHLGLSTDLGICNECQHKAIDRCLWDWPYMPWKGFHIRQMSNFDLSLSIILSAIRNCLTDMRYS